MITLANELLTRVMKTIQVLVFYMGICNINNVFIIFIYSILCLGTFFWLFFQTSLSLTKFLQERLQEMKLQQGCENISGL